METMTGAEASGLMSAGLRYIELAPNFAYGSLTVSPGRLTVDITPEKAGLEHLKAVDSLLCIIGGSNVSAELGNFLPSGTAASYGQTIHREGQPEVRVQTTMPPDMFRNHDPVSEHIQKAGQRLARHIGSLALPVSSFTLRFLQNNIARANLDVACRTDLERAELHDFIQRNGTINVADDPYFVGADALLATKFGILMGVKNVA